MTCTFRKYQLIFLLLLSLVFLFPKKNNLPCVSGVNDFVDTHLWRVFANIFAKTHHFAKLFLPVHIGPRWRFFYTKISKISWHCPFNPVCTAWLPDSAWCGPCAWTAGNVLLLLHPRHNTSLPRHWQVSTFQVCTWCPLIDSVLYN